MFRSLTVYQLTMAGDDLEPLLGGWPHQEVLDLHDLQEGGAAA